VLSIDDYFSITPGLPLLLQRAQLCPKKKSTTVLGKSNTNDSVFFFGRSDAALIVVVEAGFGRKIITAFIGL